MSPNGRAAVESHDGTLKPKPRILIIEDDEGLSQALALGIKRTLNGAADVEVLDTHETPEAEMDALKVNPPALIISDNDTPAANNGIGMLEAMAKEPLLKETGVMFMSGYEGALRRAENYPNVVQTFSKPIDLATMREAVSRYLGDKDVLLGQEAGR